MTLSHSSEERQVPQWQSTGKPRGARKGVGTEPGAQTPWALCVLAAMVQSQLTPRPVGQDSQELEGSQQ